MCESQIGDMHECGVPLLGEEEKKQGTLLIKYKSEDTQSDN